MQVLDTEPGDVEMTKEVGRGTLGWKGRVRVFVEVAVQNDLTGAEDLVEQGGGGDERTIHTYAGNGDPASTNLGPRTVWIDHTLGK